MNHTLKVASAFVLVAVAGCASSPALRTESSSSAIRAAEAVGGSDVPRAALHLQLAKEELERAQALGEKGDKERATSLLTRAEADADLALLLSRQDSEKSEATLARARVVQLQKDNR